MPRAMTLFAAFVIATGLAHSAAFAEGQSTFTPAASQRFDPYKNFRFRIVFEGRTVGGFAEVSGLSADDSNVVNYREGGATPVQKIHGLNKSTDVTLKRGVIKATDLEAWLQDVQSSTAGTTGGTTGDSGSSATQKIQGINKNTDITLKRGVVDDTGLEAWLASVRSSHVRKDMRVQIADGAGSVSRVFVLHRAWVTKIQAPALNGKSNDVAIEELVLGHEGIELLPPP